ncbi:hypothetical protein D9M68_421370 [compost metagenome]
MGQQQAEHPDQAGGQVRGVDQTVGNQEAQVFQAGVRRRGGAGKQQHHAGHEHQQRQHRCGQAGGGAQSLAAGREQALRLIGQQQQAGQHQWQADVDQAVEQQGGRQRCGTQLPGEGRQQNGFEHADPARDMAQYASGQGQHVDQQESAERRRVGQQYVEHAGGGADIRQCDQQLQRRQAQTGQAHAAVAQADIDATGHRRLGGALARNPEDQGGAGQQHAQGDEDDKAFRQAQGDRGCARGAQGCQRCQ